MRVSILNLTNVSLDIFELWISRHFRITICLDFYMPNFNTLRFIFVIGNKGFKKEIDFRKERYAK